MSKGHLLGCNAVRSVLCTGPKPGDVAQSEDVLGVVVVEEEYVSRAWLAGT